MQECLDNNNIFMYSKHSEGESVITERFIKHLEVKIYNKMTANESKSYLLNTIILVIILLVKKKPINSNYSALTGKSERNPKVSKFIVDDRVRITNYKNIFSKVYTENWSRKTFFINSVLKTNHWSIKLRI